jgi:hypothetical protein
MKVTASAFIDFREGQQYFVMAQVHLSQVKLPRKGSPAREACFKAAEGAAKEWIGGKLFTKADKMKSPRELAKELEAEIKDALVFTKRNLKRKAIA